MHCILTVFMRLLKLRGGLMETLKLPKIRLGIAALAFALAGCNAESLNSSASHVGKVRIHSHGAKTSALILVSAKIMIRQVQIRDVSGKFITFLEENFELDLLTLASSAAPILAKARIPSGYYNHIRLITDGIGTVELSDGRKLDLVVPSGDQTGIKIFFDEPLRVTRETIGRVKLEYDLDQSFHATGSDHSPGGIQNYHFRPVIRADLTEIADETPDSPTEVVTDDGEHVSPTPSPSPSSSPSPSNVPSDPVSGTDPGGTTVVDYPVIGI